MSVIGLGIKKYNNSNNTDLNDGITSSTLNMTNTYQKKEETKVYGIIAILILDYKY